MGLGRGARLRPGLLPRGSLESGRKLSVRMGGSSSLAGKSDGTKAQGKERFLRLGLWQGEGCGG